MGIRNPREFNNNILFNFDTLIDLRIGVVKALQEDFSPGEFSPKINYSFLSNNEMAFKTMRILNMEEDIVQNCFLGDMRDSYLDIYKSYIEGDEYNRIISLSPITVMPRLIRMYYRSKIITPYVLCKNEFEKQKAMELTSSTATCIIDIPQNINARKYARICVSNISDILYFHNVRYTHIAVLNYGQNFTIIEGIKTLLPNIVVLAGDTNEFEIIDPFDNLEEPVG